MKALTCQPFFWLIWHPSLPGTQSSPHIQYQPHWLHCCHSCCSMSCTFLGGHWGQIPHICMFAVDCWSHELLDPDWWCYEIGCCKPWLLLLACVLLWCRTKQVVGRELMLPAMPIWEAAEYCISCTYFQYIYKLVWSSWYVCLNNQYFTVRISHSWNSTLIQSSFHYIANLKENSYTVLE